MLSYFKSVAVSTLIFSRPKVIIVRILQLANKVPYPAKDGGAIAIHALTMGLLRSGHAVKVIAVNSPKLFTDESKIPDWYKQQTAFEGVMIDTRVKPLAAFLNLFTEESYNVSRFVSKAMELKLVETLSSETFDVVQLESVFMAPYVDVIRKHSNAKIALRAHNIEHKIWQRLAANTVNPLKKWYLRLLAKRLKKYELSMLNKYDGIACINQHEVEELKNYTATPICYTPFGIDVAKVDVSNSSEEPLSVFSLAAMDWQPNLEGLHWFLEHVWSKVLQQIPEAKFYVAGRNMNDAWKEKTYQNVVMVGEVDDAKTFMQSKQVMVVPLFSGGGVRVKIIEGFAHQKAMVSTPVGAEGINCTHENEILIAEHPGDFANAIVRLLQDDSLRKSIAMKGRELALREYDLDAVVSNLTSFYKSLLR